MKRFIKLTLATVFAIAGIYAFHIATPAYAVDVIQNSCSSGGAGSPLCESDEELPNMITSVVNLLLAVLGFVAVLMIIIGGIRYATSNGDASQTKAAKDTVLYAVIGLVVAILAYAIVNFVLDFFI